MVQVCRDANDTRYCPLPVRALTFSFRTQVDRAHPCWGQTQPTVNGPSTAWWLSAARGAG